MQILDLDTLLDSSTFSAASDAEHPQLRELAGRETVSVEDILELARHDTLIGSRVGGYRCVKLSSVL